MKDWPYANWKDFVDTDVDDWINDRMSVKREGLFLANCQVHITLVLTALWFAARKNEQ